MLLIVLVGLCIISVPLAGGRLIALADLKLRFLDFLATAVALQALIIYVAPHGSPGLHAAAHIISYALAGVFLVANRRVPGLWLVGLGGALNLAAIAANGGVMPVHAAALSGAGLAEVPGRFTNSATIAGANLGFLGDVFFLPASWPFHNVFSIGDVCIVAGAALALHRICKSRLFPARGGQFAQLRRSPDFMRAWAAQAVSNIGDWVYTLAVAISLSANHGTAKAFALVFVLQLAPSAVIGALGGPLVDRFSRKKLMIASDVLRALAVASLFVGGPPSKVHLYAVAFLLGAFGALFLPSFQASLPNLVPEGQVVAANALVSSTFHVAVMIGPILGGILVSHVGAGPAFAINALSFVVSALLLTRVHLPRSAVDEDQPSASPVEALTQGLRYIKSTPLVRGVLMVLGMIMLAAAIKTPLEPLFVLRGLGRPVQALGLVGGAWGVGMVLGSLLAPSAVRRWARERLFGLSIAVVGLAVVAASQQRALSPVLVLWLLAGIGNGMGTVSYESLLQERVPDAYRGRVMAASEAILDTAFLVGAVVAGYLADRVGIRTAFALSGAMFLAAALLTRVMLIAQRGQSEVLLPSDEATEFPVSANGRSAQRAGTLRRAGSASAPEDELWLAERLHAVVCETILSK
jgi:MFS family permease